MHWHPHASRLWPSEYATQFTARTRSHNPAKPRHTSLPERSRGNFSWLVRSAPGLARSVGESPNAAAYPFRRVGAVPSRGSWQGVHPVFGLMWPFPAREIRQPIWCRRALLKR